MVVLTPVRVRGKRTGTKAEKGRDKSRLKIRSARPSPIPSNHTSRSSSKAVTKRRRRDRELAMIEQLPVELIEDIFERSRNLDLPAASPILHHQLGHPHLYKRILDQAMARLLFYRDELGNQLQPSASDDDVAHAVRVVNSRFCTWELLSSWLCPSKDKMPDSGTSPGPRPDYSRVAPFLWLFDPPADRLEEAIFAYKSRFGRLILPVPSKLLAGPFHPDKERLLVLLLQYSNVADIDMAIPRDEDLHRALEDAMVQQKADLVKYLALHGASIGRVRSMAPELLRIAVIEHGCNRAIVGPFIEWASLDLPDRTNLYLELWRWAEDAERASNDDGKWLKELLRRARP